MKTAKQRFKFLVSKTMLREINKMVTRGGYSSKSALIEDLIRKEFEREAEKSL